MGPFKFRREKSMPYFHQTPSLATCVRNPSDDPGSRGARAARVSTKPEQRVAGLGVFLCAHRLLAKSPATELPEILRHAERAERDALRWQRVRAAQGCHNPTVRERFHNWSTCCKRCLPAERPTLRRFTRPVKGVTFERRGAANNPARADMPPASPPAGAAALRNREHGSRRRPIMR